MKPVGIIERGALFAVISAFLVCICAGQNNAVERKFPQSKAQVERGLKTLESAMAGRLPVVEGFAAEGEYPLSGYRRAYYQSTVRVDSTAGGTVVRVSTKVTAWYTDISPAKSGY